VLKISLCHATYNSGRLSLLIRDAWFRSAISPERIQHCVGLENSDLITKTEYGIADGVRAGISNDRKSHFVVTTPRSDPSAVRNWNAAADLSDGDLLVAIADDTVPEYGWDHKIDTLFSGGSSKLALLNFTDARCHQLDRDSRDSLLPRHPAMTRELYKKLNYLFPPEFNGLGADLALLRQALQHGFLLDARNIKIHHAFGNVLDNSGNLICFCEVRVVNSRSFSQKKIHSESESHTSLSELKLSPLIRLLIRISCSRRYSDNVLSSYKFGRQNNLILLTGKAVVRTLIQKITELFGSSKNLT
jgi:hypothetical protein